MNLCCVVAPQNKGWILDRIAKEVAKGFDESIVHYDLINLPKADHYFVTHYSLIKFVLDQQPTAKVNCFFTHDKGNLREFSRYFNKCNFVIAENPEGAELLKSFGVHQDIVHFVPEGGDSDLFKPHQRTDEGSILVCGNNYEDGRKNPDLIQGIADCLPNREFILLGKDWTKVVGKNVSYGNYDYVSYPDIYEKCSVYLSCSKLEGGGPNSLIEAMHANLVPVVSDTGNAREYITDGYNGLIFGKDATAEQVAELLEKAYLMQPQNSIPYNDIWQTVRSFTWKNYALQVREILLSDYSITNSQELLDDDNDSTN